MSDLIRREDVIKLILARYENPEIYEAEIYRIPTVDAVPVVRCGCCKRCHLRGREWFCEVHGITQSDDFCSYGERKDGAE